MFQIGLDFEFSHLKEPQNSKAVMLVSFLGLLTPFMLGLAVGYSSHDILAPTANPIAYALFIATALSITAVPILGRIMMELGLTRTPVGVITITSAAINDVVGWITLAAVTSLTVSKFSLMGMLSNWACYLSTASSAGGFCALYCVVCWLTSRFIQRIYRKASLPYCWLQSFCPLCPPTESVFLPFSVDS